MSFLHPNQGFSAKIRKISIWEKLTKFSGDSVLGKNAFVLLKVSLAKRESGKYAGGDLPFCLLITQLVSCRRKTTVRNDEPIKRRKRNHRPIRAQNRDNKTFP